MSLYFYNYAFFSVPLYQIVVLFNTYPFLASVLGYFINGEKVLKIELTAIVFCFLGVLCFGISKAQEEEEKSVGKATFA